MGYLRSRGAASLSVLEVGCSFGHMTGYLAEQPEIGGIWTFDIDPAFVAIVRTTVEELGLHKVREVSLFGNDETRRVPYPDGRFDLVRAVGVVEQLPARTGARRWTSPTACSTRPATSRDATLGECLPSSGWAGLVDVTEEAGYRWRFFHDTARSGTRQSLLPVFRLMATFLRGLGDWGAMCLRGAAQVRTSGAKYEVNAPKSWSKLVAYSDINLLLEEPDQTMRT